MILRYNSLLFFFAISSSASIHPHENNELKISSLSKLARKKVLSNLTVPQILKYKEEGTWDLLFPLKRDDLVHFCTGLVAIQYLDCLRMPKYTKPSVKDFFSNLLKPFSPMMSLLDIIQDKEVANCCKQILEYPSHNLAGKRKIKKQESIASFLDGLLGVKCKNLYYLYIYLDLTWQLKTILALLDLILGEQKQISGFRYLKFSYLLSFLEGHVDFLHDGFSPFPYYLSYSRHNLHSMLSCNFTNNGVTPFIGIDEWAAMQKRISLRVNIESDASAIILSRTKPNLLEIMFPHDRALKARIQAANESNNLRTRKGAPQLLFFPLLASDERVTRCGERQFRYIFDGSSIILYHNPLLDQKVIFALFYKGIREFALNVDILGKNASLIMCHFRKDTEESKFYDFSSHNSFFQTARKILIPAREEDYVAFTFVDEGDKETDKEMGALIAPDRIAQQFAHNFDFHSLIFALNDHGYFLFKFISC